MLNFEDFNGVGLPTDSTLDTVLTGLRFEAMDNFLRTFAFKPDDKLVFLADRKLDPRVIHAICGVARSRGIRPWVIMSDTTQHTEVPAEIRPIVEQATFVVSSWFCSIIDPFCRGPRASAGSRSPISATSTFWIRTKRVSRSIWSAKLSVRLPRSTRNRAISI